MKEKTSIWPGVIVISLCVLLYFIHIYRQKKVYKSESAYSIATLHDYKKRKEKLKYAPGSDYSEAEDKINYSFIANYKTIKKIQIEGFGLKSFPDNIEELVSKKFLVVYKINNPRDCDILFKYPIESNITETEFNTLVNTFKENEL